jgi:serine/threonine protein phosphatase PrpC
VKRSVLTSGLGLRHGRVDVEVQHVRLADRDRLVLSTDGLTEVVDEGTIAAILGSADSAEAAASALVTETLKSGAPDNVTALVADYRMPSAT